VGWISSSINIGWFPLAPFEIYYSHRYWGPRSRVIQGRYNYYYGYRNYRHYRHARVLRHEDLYRHNNYQGAGLRKVQNHNNYRGAAFASNKAYNQKNRIDKYKSTNDRLRYKPQESKISSIRKNNSVKTRSLKYNNRPLKSSISKTVETSSEKDRLNTPGKNRVALNKKRPANVSTDSVKKRFSNNDPKKSLTQKRTVAPYEKKLRKNAARDSTGNISSPRKITKGIDGSKNPVLNKTKKAEVKEPGKSLRERSSERQFTTLPSRTSQRNTPKGIQQKTRDSLNAGRTVKTVQKLPARTSQRNAPKVIKQKTGNSLKPGRALKPVQTKTVRTSQERIKTPSVLKQNRSRSDSSISTAKSRANNQRSYGSVLSGQNRNYKPGQSRNYPSRQSSNYVGAVKYGNARSRRN
jgi:hypothetical protein